MGTSTIVEHLSKKGFDIENKPTANITEEMELELMKEFSKSIAIKEMADQLKIGIRPATPAVNKPDVPAPPVSKSSGPVVNILKKEEPAAPAKPATPPAPENEEPAPVVEKPKLKILGRIDLDRPAKPKQPTPDPVKPAEEPVPLEPVHEPAAPVEHVEETPVVIETPPAPEKTVVEEVAEPIVQETVEVTPPPASDTQEIAPVVATPTAAPTEGDNFHRAETPELRGLKILGKIDTDKLKKVKKKKKPTPGKPDTPAPASESRGPKPATGNNTSNNNSSNAANDDKKRKRKRKKVTAVVAGGDNKQGGNKPTGGGGNRSGGNRPAGDGDRPDNKEVSQREIEEKIKATMARLSGAGKKKRQKQRRDNRERIRERQELQEMEQMTGKLQVTEFVSVSELASLMNVPVTDVIMTCMALGVIVSINQRLDAEIIELVANEFGHEVEFISAEEQLEEEEEEEDAPEDLEPRAPIVTVMGHVDHGKTSLLDYIRSANVVKGEAGGITQHIGAYEVVVNDKKISFLDTPGHEAFTAMRARGAKITDIAVIVVAADDSIMPQTREAISHAQAAGVPIVFAINKIDKQNADPTRIKQDLAGMNLLVEEWGGKYQSQDISAKTGLNIDLLLEKILLEAEVLELQANPDRKAVGVVLEASLDKGRGYVCKIMVQNGTLEIGDPIVAGEYSGKVKAMYNETGKKIKSAGPSTPVLVLGLSGAPQAGEKFKVYENEYDARQIASKRAQISREQANRATKRISLDEIGRRLALGTFKELNLIVKGDVDGSVEALSDSLIKLSLETVQVNVIHKGVGQITESDVLLASASDAIIIGFQVRPSVNARKLAEKEGVQIKLYSIIYEAIEEIKLAIQGMLEPTKEERIIAQVAVREVYKISKVGTVAGCFVEEGKITRNTHVRIVRDGIVIFPTREGANGEISSLKRFKEDVREVKNGMECGVTIRNFNDIKVGDVIEGYEVVEVKATAG